MEHYKKFEFYLDDLTDEAKARFIKFLGGDGGNHDVIPFSVYENICEGCEWECDCDGVEGEDD